MPVLFGLEVVAGVAVAGALRRVAPETTAAVSGRISSVATGASSAVTSFVYGSSSTDDDAPTTAGAPASAAGPAAAAAPPVAKSETPPSPFSPTRVNLRAVKALRLPRLLGPSSALGEPAHATVLTNGAMLEQVAAAVPRRYGDTGGAWHLLFSTALDGTSLLHLLRRAAGAGPCLLLLRDDARRVFGAYVSELREPPKAGGAAGPEGHLFYGSGETFLLALGEMKLPPVPERVVTPPSAPTSPKRAAGGTRCVAFSFGWRRERNRHFVRADADGLVVGAGGHFGLSVDGSLSEGNTGCCETFGNPPLTRCAAPRSAVSDVPLAASPLGGNGGGASPMLVRELSYGGGGVTGHLSPANVERESSASEVERFRVVQLEVWGVDERECRKARGDAAEHVPIRQS